MDEAIIYALGSRTSTPNTRNISQKHRLLAAFEIWMHIGRWVDLSIITCAPCFEHISKCFGRGGGKFSYTLEVQNHLRACTLPMNIIVYHPFSLRPISVSCYLFSRTKPKGVLAHLDDLLPILLPIETLQHPSQAASLNWNLNANREPAFRLREVLLQLDNLANVL